MKSPIFLLIITFYYRFYIKLQIFMYKEFKIKINFRSEFILVTIYFYLF